MKHTFFLEDGRKGERLISETDSERIVETYLEPERPKVLSTRVVEKKRPEIFERTVETLDELGQVVEIKTQSIDPAPMRIVEHIGIGKVEPVLSVQSVSQPITKQDLESFGEALAESTKDGIIAAFETMNQVVKSPVVSDAQYVVQSKLEQIKKAPTVNVLLWALAAAFGGYWVYSYLF